MAAFNKFEDFMRALCEKEHNLATTGDTLKVYLSNAAPSASADTVIGDVADLATGGGYTAGGEDTTNTGSETTGMYTVAMTDVVWTASGTGIGAFQYVILYNDTHASDALIGWWDYGSAITLTAGETFTTDFGATTLTLI